MAFVILDSETGRYIVSDRVSVKVPELARVFKTDKQAKAYRRSKAMNTKRYGVIEVTLKEALYTCEQIKEIVSIRLSQKNMARSKERW